MKLYEFSTVILVIFEFLRFYLGLGTSVVVYRAEIDLLHKSGSTTEGKNRQDIDYCRRVLIFS